MKREDTINDVCEAIDVDRRTIYGWIKRGLPSEGEGKARRFNLGEVAAWMKANKLTGAPGRPQEPLSAELVAARTRKELALADLHEMQLGRMRECLVDASDVARANAMKYAVIREVLLNIPETASPMLVGLAIHEIERVLAEAVRDALGHLSKQ